MNNDTEYDDYNDHADEGYDHNDDYEEESTYEPETDCDVCDYRPVQKGWIGWYCPSCGRSAAYRTDDPKRSTET